ncbi:MAG: 3-mercaptopyruvate sulfurtransferase [Marinosulfonomonas sp.]|nr:3-mercaptopyruvate sulfurtransferase [Marinosulfonomonas sp.]
MPHSDRETLVSSSWLADRLEKPDIHILDASWYLPNMNRDGQAEFGAQHIPGAQFFDIDEIAELGSPLPHMAPPVEKFVSRVRAMGIGNRDQVVVYDGAGIFSAARVWWLFRLMGKSNVAVLDGGLPKWQSEGHTITSTPAEPATGHLIAMHQAHMVRDAQQVGQASENGTAQIVDARPLARFRGEEPEPRAGLTAGHIPGSRSLFFKDLLNDDCTMKTNDAMRAVFTAAGVDLQKPVITTCGSGVTAAVLSLALERLGHPDHSLYDGSWSEWGAFDTSQIATGDA